MSFDPRCWDLAEDFLQDTPKPHDGQDVNELAQQIQDCIETFIVAMEETRDVQ